MPVGAAGPAAANTWTLLAPLPERLESPLFALAVSPGDPQLVLAGTSSGAIYRSTDAGASWRLVRTGLGRGVASLAFDPFRPGVVLAGTRGEGIWRSADSGQTWQPQPGTEKRTVRAFGFARSLVIAGSDGGPLVVREGGAWAPGGLTQVVVSAVAVAAGSDPPRLVVGGDAASASVQLPLYGSGDGGISWKAVEGTVGGSSVVSALAAPLTQSPSRKGAPPGPILMGTNAGLFVSSDGGASWQVLTGGGTLPATDFSAVAFVAGRSDRFYVASDGGASDRGGLWATADGGAHFSSLQPPVPAVTALALSNEDRPLLYVATFRPLDHAVMLWSYRDTGGSPQGPAGGVPSARSTPTGEAPQPASGGDWLTVLLKGPEAPYLALGLGAVLVLLAALVAYLRRARGL